MAEGRKYAALPDLDSAPDVYETPEIEDGASTADSSTARSPSMTSSVSLHDHHDDDDGDDDDAAGDETIRLREPSGIDQARTDPARAREQFGPARVDARGVDFSDRIAGDRLRRSYRVSSRGRRRRVRGLNGAVVDEYGNFDDDEEGDDEEEGFDKRLARLRREVEEVRLEADKRRAANGDGEDYETARDAVQGQEEIAQLSSILRELQSVRPPAGTTLAPRATNAASQSQQAQQPSTADQPQTASSASPPPPPHAPAAPSSEAQTRLLSRAITLESRLAGLESLLGISALALPNPTPSITHPDHDDPGAAPNVDAAGAGADHTASSATALDKPILTSLTLLETTLQTLTHTSAAHLAPLEAQIADLRSSAATTRTAAAPLPFPLSRPGSMTAAAGALGSQAFSGGGSGADTPSAAAAAAAQAAAQTAKRLAPLYDALPTLHALAPLLPATITRLRSLRALHADAAGAREALGELERGLARQDAEVARWREALERVEEAVDRGERGGAESRGAVEGWVRELESRVERIGAGGV